MSYNDEVVYSDQILERAALEGRGLTKSERGELREAYLHEQNEKDKQTSMLQKSMQDFKDNTFDPINMPRHKVAYTCPNFVECPIDYKCRAYDPKYVACNNCVLHETDDVCKKPHIHTERAFNMMIKPGRVDLDARKVE